MAWHKYSRCEHCDPGCTKHLDRSFYTERNAEELIAELARLRETDPCVLDAEMRDAEAAQTTVHEYFARRRSEATERIYGRLRTERVQVTLNIDAYFEQVMIAKLRGPGTPRGSPRGGGPSDDRSPPPGGAGSPGATPGTQPDTPLGGQPPNGSPSGALETPDRESQDYRSSTEANDHHDLSGRDQDSYQKPKSAADRRDFESMQKETCNVERLIKALQTEIDTHDHVIRKLSFSPLAGMSPPPLGPDGSPMPPSPSAVRNMKRRPSVAKTLTRLPAHKVNARGGVPVVVARHQLADLYSQVAIETGFRHFETGRADRDYRDPMKTGAFDSMRELQDLTDDVAASDQLITNMRAGFDGEPDWLTFMDAVFLGRAIVVVGESLTGTMINLFKYIMMVPVDILDGYNEYVSELSVRQREWSESSTYITFDLAVLVGREVKIRAALLGMLAPAYRASLEARFHTRAPQPYMRVLSTPVVVALILNAGRGEFDNKGNSKALGIELITPCPKALSLDKWWRRIQEVERRFETCMRQTDATVFDYDRGDKTATETRYLQAMTLKPWFDSFMAHVMAPIFSDPYRDPMTPEQLYVLFESQESTRLTADQFKSHARQQVNQVSGRFSDAAEHARETGAFDFQSVNALQSPPAHRGTSLKGRPEFKTRGTGEVSRGRQPTRGDAKPDRTARAQPSDKGSRGRGRGKGRGEARTDKVIVDPDRPRYTRQDRNFTLGPVNAAEYWPSDWTCRTCKDGNTCHGACPNCFTHHTGGPNRDFVAYCRFPGGGAREKWLKEHPGDTRYDDVNRAPGSLCMLCGKDHSELNCAKKLKKLAQLLWSHKGWVLNKFGTLKPSRVNAVMSAWQSGEYVIDPDDYDWVDASADHPAATHIQSVRIVSAISAMGVTHGVIEADHAHDDHSSSYDDGHNEISAECSDDGAGRDDYASDEDDGYYTRFHMHGIFARKAESVHSVACPRPGAKSRRRQTQHSKMVAIATKSRMRNYIMIDGGAQTNLSPFFQHYTSRMRKTSTIMSGAQGVDIWSPGAGMTSYPLSQIDGRSHVLEPEVHYAPDAPYTILSQGLLEQDGYWFATVRPGRCLTEHDPVTGTAVSFPRNETHSNIHYMVTPQGGMIHIGMIDGDSSSESLRFARLIEPSNRAQADALMGEEELTAVQGENLTYIKEAERMAGREPSIAHASGPVSITQVGASASREAGSDSHVSDSDTDPDDVDPYVLNKLESIRADVSEVDYRRSAQAAKAITENMLLKVLKRFGAAATPVVQTLNAVVASIDDAEERLAELAVAPTYQLQDTPVTTHVVPSRDLVSVCLRCARQHCTATGCSRGCTDCGSPAGTPHTAVCSVLGIVDEQQNALTESAPALHEDDSDPEPETGESTRPRHTDLQSELIALAAVEHVQRHATAVGNRNAPAMPASAGAPIAPGERQATNDSTQTTSCAAPAEEGTTRNVGHLSAEEIAYCYSITVSPAQDHSHPCRPPVSEAHVMGVREGSNPPQAQCTRCEEEAHDGPCKQKCGGCGAAPSWPHANTCDRANMDKVIFVRPGYTLETNLLPEYWQCVRCERLAGKPCHSGSCRCLDCGLTDGHTSECKKMKLPLNFLLVDSAAARCIQISRGSHGPSEAVQAATMPVQPEPTETSVVANDIRRAKRLPEPTASEELRGPY